MVVKVNRTYKSSVFRMLFEDKKNLLELYNALNRTSYEDVDQVEIYTLENAIYMKVKNDISFILNMSLYLFEHQSTVNPNIPLRDLFYISSLFGSLTADKDLYALKLFTIPEPRFIVFYNGTAAQEDVIEYRLSEMYDIPSADPDLDLRVTVYNVNAGHSGELMDASRTLYEYSIFVQTVRDKCAIMDIDKAVDAAVVECIQKGILRDFLMKHRAEVIEMSIFEYNEELHLKSLYDDGREDERELSRQEIEKERKRAEEAGRRSEEADRRAEEAGRRAEDAGRRAEEEKKRAEKERKRAENLDEQVRMLKAQLAMVNGSIS